MEFETLSPPVYINLPQNPTKPNNPVYTIMPISFRFNITSSMQIFSRLVITFG